ncbi:NXPE family member 1-like [Ptychodera flava]|uniref:NXPE family member 1-like n=1 Tax=Ptychodera flava TaxID=63121 RepID=UPI00396A84D1
MNIKRLYLILALGSMLLCITVYHGVNVYGKLSVPILTNSRKTLVVPSVMSMLPPYWNSTNGELGSMNVTDASRTLLTPISNLTVIHYGDVIKLRLDAKDVNGRQRVHGGDFWKALLTNKNYGKCSVPGHVEDLGNGTYFVIFVAKCVGQSTIVISLTHTREAVRCLEREFIPLEDKTAWHGYFGTGAKSSHTMCWLHREGTWENKCEYRYKTGLGRSLLLCDKPPNNLVPAFTILWPYFLLKQQSMSRVNINIYLRKNQKLSQKLRRKLLFLKMIEIESPSNSRIVLQRL